MACIILRVESGGNPYASNVNAATGDDSHGLLQINLRASLLPGRLAMLRSLGYEVWTRDEAVAVLQDPIANLRAGLVLSGGGYDFGPWKWACS